MKTLIKICEHKPVAERKVWKRIMDETSSTVTKLYKDVGCYDCNGYGTIKDKKEDCPYYFTHHQKYLDWKREYGK